MPSVAKDPVRFTSVLTVRRERVLFLARLLHLQRLESGTRRGTRALGPFRQAVLVLRWFADNTRVRQLACDFDIGKSTAYDYLHEGIDVLAGIAPEDATRDRILLRTGTGFVGAGLLAFAAAFSLFANWIKGGAWFAVFAILLGGAFVGIGIFHMGHLLLEKASSEKSVSAAPGRGIGKETSIPVERISWWRRG